MLPVKERGGGRKATKRFSPLPPRLSFFWLSFHFRAAKTKNLVPRSFFNPKPTVDYESPFLAWGDFHARSRFARSTIPRRNGGLLVVYPKPNGNACYAGLVLPISRVSMHATWTASHVCFLRSLTKFHTGFRIRQSGRPRNDKSLYLFTIYWQFVIFTIALEHCGVFEKAR